MLLQLKECLPLACKHPFLKVQSMTRTCIFIPNLLLIILRVPPFEDGDYFQDLNKS
jgi:hypothetical protein